MKWLFVIWLFVVMFSLFAFSAYFLSVIIKIENKIKIIAVLVVKYLIYLLAIIFPASILTSVLNVDNSAIYILILFLFDVVIVVFLVTTKKQSTAFFLFVFVPVLPPIVFFLMAREVKIIKGV